MNLYVTLLTIDFYSKMRWKFRHMNIVITFSDVRNGGYSKTEKRYCCVKISVSFPIHDLRDI